MVRKPKVFISYAREDVETVREVYRFLLTHGCDPWMDEVKLIPGQDWEYEIEVAIEASDFFIACLSNNSVDKRGYIQKELKKGLDVFQRLPEGRIYTIPIRLDECTVPRSFSKQHYLNWFDQEARIKLLASLDVERHNAHEVTPVTGEQPKPQKLETPIESIILKLNTEYALPESPRKSRVNIIRYTPDGKYLVSGLNQDQVAMWDTDSGQLTNMVSPRRSAYMRGLDWPTYSIAISPNGTFLATPTYEQEIQIWHLSGLKTYRLIETVNHAPISVAFSPDGEWLVAGLDKDGDIYSWSLNDDFRRVDHIKAHKGRVEELKFHPTKLNFVSCSDDGSIRYWTIVKEEIKEIRSFEGHDHSHVVDVAFSPDGRLLASASVSGQIHLWEIETGELVGKLKHEQVVRTLAFSADSRLLASGANDRTLKIWRLVDNTELLSKKFEHAVSTIDFSPDGQLLATATESSRTIQIWQVKRQ